MESTQLKIVFLVIFCLFCNSCGQDLRFTNPILDPSMSSRAHPNGFALKLGTNYYLVGSQDEEDGIAFNLSIWQSPILTDFHNATQKVIKLPFSAVPDQMHLIDGELYIYAYTLIREFGFGTYALKARNSSDPMAEWGEPVLVASDPDYATVMKHGDKNYLISAVRQSTLFEYDIFITELITPTRTSGDTILLKHPTEEYECYRNREDYNVCANFAPALLYTNNMTYLILTARNGTTLANNQLIQMSITIDKDPLNPSNWNHDGQVFASDEDEGVFGPGGYGTSFVESPDMTETWMVYTATDYVNETYTWWTPRLEKIDWNADGSPKFPRAHGRNSSQPVPSGQALVL